MGDRDPGISPRYYAAAGAGGAAVLPAITENTSRCHEHLAYPIDVRNYRLARIFYSNYYHLLFTDIRLIAVSYLSSGIHKSNKTTSKSYRLKDLKPLSVCQK